MLGYGTCKTTISFIVSLRPSDRLSVRMEELGFHWTDCREISYLSIFLNSIEKIQVCSKYDKNNGYLT